jgi:hypothetical protein
MRSNERYSRAGPKPGPEDFAGANVIVTVTALPTAICVISWSYVMRSVVNGLWNKLPESSELKRRFCRLREVRDCNMWVEIVNKGREKTIAYP